MAGNVPQMQTFLAKPGKTDDTTIAEEPSVDQTIDPEDTDMLKDDTIDETAKNSSTPLKPKEKNTSGESDAPDDHTQEEEEEHEDEDEDEPTGTSVLPLSRIKKIFKTDPDHVSASEAAVFTTAIATELFIQYFTEQASLIARSEKRKKLQYKDFSAAVSNIEQLYFLSDTVPKTHNLEGLVKTNKVKYSAGKPIEKDQRPLQFGRKKTAGEPTKKVADDDDIPDSDVDDYGDVYDSRYPESNLGSENNAENTDDEEDEANQSARVDNDHDIIMVDQ